MVTSFGLFMKTRKLLSPVIQTIESTEKKKSTTFNILYCTNIIPWIGPPHFTD